MAEELATASMYALRALVEGLRAAGILNQRALEEIERRTEYDLHHATVLETATVPRQPDEARALRHGIWWLRECLASTAGYQPGPINDHPWNPNEWPKLAEPQADDE